ncbi:MAG: S26 family signal peptidase [Isosphaeraceae bacterium]
MPPTTARKSPATRPSPPSSGDAGGARKTEGHRETVESFVVAAILAVLIRAFLAEAFVIPTGSMAPTLMGRHKDVECDECHHNFQVNVHTDAAGRDVPTSNGVCDNCRVPMRVAPLPSFKGDRILVMKFPFAMPWLPGSSGPTRWDVIVFKYPENPDQNFIKRMVGLPGEELLILGGDVLTRKLGSEEPFRFARKPIRHLLAMQMPVYDDSHRPGRLAGKKEWQRWAPAAEGIWSEPEPGKFASGNSSDWAELAYRHLVPTRTQWDDLLHDRPTSAPQARLITDFYSYNSGGGPSEHPHWVGDLTLSCRVDVEAAQGQLALELIKGGIPYRCEIDIATGQATLSRYGESLGQPAATALRGAGAYDLTLANVDGRLTLLVNGQAPATLGDGVEYDDGTQPRTTPTEADLKPARISSRGAKLKVSRLLLRRDIHYTKDPNGSDYAAMSLSDNSSTGDDFTDPARFGNLAVTPGKTYAIGEGKYMMMGDNSPQSSDGRAWRNDDREWDTTDRQTWEVPESMIVGKAFFVYWPHGKPFGPEFLIPRTDIRVPFRPYVERMKWIR